MAQGSTSTSVRDIQYGLAATNISGTVGIHYHHAQARSQTPPLPTHNIPFDRNTHFIDREDIFSKISIKCSGRAARVALVGLGGVGKSQLAIEHGHRTRLEYPETWVLWCHASNTARLNSSLSEIASLVRAPGYDSPQPDYFQLVKSWLHDPKNRNWLLIIDNADDKGVMSHQDSASTSRPLRALYQGSDGCVLITSRTKGAARELVEDHSIIEIHPMKASESQELLKDQLTLDSSTEDLKALAEALENMPLALTQAAAYIRRHAPRTSVKQYLELFQQNDQSKINLLSKAAGHLHRDWDAKSSILTTLMISFKDIREMSPSAADLLCLMSFFDRQGIPEELIRPQADDDSSEDSGVGSSISSMESTESLPMATIQEDEEDEEDEENKEDQEKEIKEESEEIKETKAVEENKEDKERIQETEKIEASKENEDNEKDKEGDQFCNGEENSDDDAGSEVEELEDEDSILEHEEIASLHSNYRSIRRTRNLEDSENFESDIEILRDYAFIKINTAGTFEMHALVQLATSNWLYSLDEYDFWRDRSIDALCDRFCGVFDPEFRERDRYFTHVKMVISNRPQRQDILRDWAGLMFNAGSHALDKGFLHDAMQMLMLSWTTRVSLHGEYHEKTLSSLYETGRVIFERLKGHHPDEQDNQRRFLENVQGLWKKAPDLTCKKESWAVLFEICEIAARIYMTTTRFSDAETLLTEGISCSIEQFGEDARETLGLQEKLARLRIKQGDIKGGESMLSEIVKKLKLMNEESHGDDDSVMTGLRRAMNALAWCLRLQNKMGDAELMYRDILDLYKDDEMGNYPNDIANAEIWLTRCLTKQKKLEEAARIIEESEKWQRAILGTLHPENHLLGAMVRLASAFVVKNEKEKAIPIFEKVLRYVGENCGNITKKEELYTIKELTYAYIDEHQYEKAINHLEQHMASNDGRSFTIHIGEWVAANSLGYCYFKLSKYDEAIEIWQEYLHSRENITAKESDDKVMVYALEHIGHAYSNQSKHTEAVIYYRKCLDEEKRSLGNKHRNTLQTMEWMAEELYESNQEQEALAQMEECVQLSKETLDSQDPDACKDIVRREEFLEELRSAVAEVHDEAAEEDPLPSVPEDSVILVQSMDQIKIEGSKKSVSKKAREWWKLKRRKQ